MGTCAVAGYGINDERLVTSVFAQKQEDILVEVKDIDIAELHKIQLKILNAVVALCKKHNLRYSLYCGTLLGAVRHGGFIPWDDDIDLTMPLKDYRNFLKYAKELSDEFVCVHRDNTRNFYHLWARVQLNGTTFMPMHAARLDVPWGIFIDIYPMIGVPDTIFRQKIQMRFLYLAKRLQHIEYYRVMRNPGWFRLLLSYLPFFLRRAVINILLDNTLCDTDKALRVGTLDGAPFEGKYAVKDWIQMTRLHFEDNFFQAPVHYDKILRRMYGDYMKLPPKEKRIPHIIEDDTIVDPHRDYRLYRKELLGK